jgi:hypothetical protein
MQFEYFSLRPMFSAHAPSSLFVQDQKGELYLSANLRLCGIGKEAHIESISLAERVREAVLPRLQKRYGADTDINIVRCSTTDRKAPERMKKDSELLEERLTNIVLATNIQP